MAEPRSTTRDISVSALDAAAERSNLTRAQFLIWMGQGLYPDSPLYNMALAFTIDGPLDPEAFARAFTGLVESADVMRTVIEKVADVPQRRVRTRVGDSQEVADFSDALEVLDFSSEASPDESLRRWVAARVVRNFDLGERLFDSALVRLGPERWVWYLNQHHLITDGWSTAVTYRRMEELYQRAVRAGAAALPDTLSLEAPSFEAYVDFERSRRGSASHERAQRHWRERAQSAPAPLEFYGRSAPTGGTTQTDRVTLDLGAERSRALRELAADPTFRAISADLSLFNVFATLLFTFLSRISGSRDLAILAPSHNRPSSSFKETMGLFIEILPIQISLEEGDSFESAYQKVARETRAFLLNSLPGTSSATHNRSYSVLLNFINATFSSFAGSPMTSEWIHPGHGDSSHCLRLQVHDFDAQGSLRLHFDLSREVFGPDAQQQTLQHFLAMVDAFLERRDRDIFDVDLRSEAERVQNLERFHEGSVFEGPEGTIVDAFAKQAAANPERTALAFEGAEVSFRELDARSSQLAQRLSILGARPGVLVGVCLRRSPELITSLLAVLKSGAAYLPLDPEYPLHRLSLLLKDSGALLLVTDDALAASLEASVTVVVDAEGRALWTADGGSRPARAAAPAAPVGPAGPAAPAPLSPGSAAPDRSRQSPVADDLAYVIYTSGSTGQPKGVAVSHRGLLNYVSWAASYYLQGQALDFAFYSSIAFDLTVTSIFVPLIAGSRVVIYRQNPGPDLAVLRVFEEGIVDVVKLTPSHLALLASLDLRGSRIQRLIVGGEDLKTGLARKIVDAYEGKVTLYNEYGPTEATVACMIHEMTPADYSLPSVPIGRPVANAQIYLLDPGSRPVPLGVVGEICIGGPGLAAGYHRRSDLTAARFIENPFRAGERIYRTGDRGRWRSPGQLEFLGRVDDQVKIRGVRIELGEVEAVLREHPGVRECAVTVVQRQVESAPDSAVRHCQRCGLPSNHPEAHLEGSDICRVCRSYDAYQEQARGYFRTMDDLRAIFAQPTSLSDGPVPEKTASFPSSRSDTSQSPRPEFDCLMLLSGGKDSTYALYQLVEMGLRVLAFTLDNGYISEGAKANMRRATDDLGVELVFGGTPAMNRIFVDSLNQFSNVCQGCFKTIYTLGLNLARARGIRVVVTGLSRGQIFETRIADFFRNGLYDPDEIDRSIVDARKAYHRRHDAVSAAVDVSAFQDDRIFEEIRIVDFYRYCDVRLGQMLSFLENRAPWIRPGDTGRSTNCLINETGIFVHKKVRGFHNYALPYSWDVRLGHKTRQETMDELDDDIDVAASERVLREIGHPLGDPANQGQSIETRLTSYYVTDDVTLSPARLRSYLLDRLPPAMVPTHFVPLESIPLTRNGKVDRPSLPLPGRGAAGATGSGTPPRTPTEIRLVQIWKEVLGRAEVGIHDNFIELGGDSILNIQLVARAKAAGLAVTPRQIFDHPTVAALAGVVTAITADTTPASEPHRPGDGKLAQAQTDASGATLAGLSTADLSAEELGDLLDEFGE